MSKRVITIKSGEQEIQMEVPVSEFAKKQGVPRTMVSSRKMTILEKLRAFFGERGIEVSSENDFDKK